MAAAKKVISIIKLALIIIAAIVVLGLAGQFSGFIKIPNLFGHELKIEKTANVISGIKKISEFTTTCYYEETVFVEKRYHTKSHAIYAKPDMDGKIDAVKTIIGSNTIENKVDAAKALVAKRAQEGVVRDSTETGDMIAFIVHGTVRAGYDLSKIAETDMRINKDTLFVKLPEAEIFDYISNPSDYELFDKVGSWSDSQVKAVKIKAVNHVREDAIDFGIIEKVQTTGKEKVCSFFKAFGFNHVVTE